MVIGPNHGTLTFHADGSFTYVPRPFFSGLDSFTYQAADTSNLSNVATVIISVSGVNVAPTANADTFSTSANTPLNFGAPGVLRNDQDDGSPQQLFSENFDELSLQPFEAGTPGSDLTDWTPNLPTDWNRDNTTTPTAPLLHPPLTGAEFFGWNAMDVDSWAAQQGDQNRSDFTRGGAGMHGTAMVVDGDAYADFIDLGSNRINTLLTTPSIPLGSIRPNSLTLEFDSSFRPEDPAPANQVGKVEVSYDNGTTWIPITDYRTESTGGSGSRLHTNDHVTLDALNPAGATTAKFRFSYLDGGNDWWWAIDNVKASGRTQSPAVNLDSAGCDASECGSRDVVVEFEWRIHIYAGSRFHRRRHVYLSGQRRESTTAHRPRFRFSSARRRLSKSTMARLSVRGSRAFK